VTAATPAVNAAREIAHEDLSDPDARDKLRGQIVDGEPARRAVELLASGRDGYIKDRAYRLLTAALDQTDVRPIDPALREQFMREEELGRMPLEEAFAELAEREPALSELGGEDDPRAFENQAGKLIGVGARSADPLLRSDLAASVVAQYVGIRQGRLEGDPRAPYLDAPITARYSGYFVGGEDRPRATN
jgi:hypothetical protein